MELEKVLFICDDNSILSQMAEAFLRRYGSIVFKVYSAGIEPKPLQLRTLQVMEEIGYELDGYHTKSIFHFNFLERIDYLITLSDFANLNITFKQDAVGSHIHWPFVSPLASAPALPESGYYPGEPPFPQAMDGFDPKIRKQPSIIALVDKITTREIYEPSQVQAAKNSAELMARFRSVRDQMECQIMSWLDGKGIGPLWWRGKR